MKFIFHKIGVGLFICLLLNIHSSGQIKITEVSTASTTAFAIYKQIHQYPELGKKEFKTAALEDFSYYTVQVKTGESFPL